jgi:hypothetical protein
MFTVVSEMPELKHCFKTHAIPGIEIEILNIVIEKW